MKLKIAFLLLFPALCFSQLSAKVDSLYREILATDQVQNGVIGMVGSITYPDYDNLYVKLDSLATDDELLYIVKKGNKVITYHVNKILVDRKSKVLADLFSQYLYNNEEINISMGCTGYESSFAGALYSTVFYQNNKIESIKYNKEHYTPEELKEYNFDSETNWTKPEVDSLLVILNKVVLSNDNVLPITLKHIFTLNKFKFDNYERVKYFANKHPEVEILATLASFQNKRDLPLFHKNIDNSFLAISKFPDKSFISELKARIDKGCDDYQYLEATASFCNKDAEELLSMIVTKFETMRDRNKKLEMSDSERFDHFYKCLEKKECSFNDDFLLKFWLNYKTISLSFFDKIKDEYYNEILKGYVNPIPIDFASMKDNMDWEKYRADFEAADGYYCPIILKYLKNNSALKKDKFIDLDSIECKG